MTRITYFRMLVVAMIALGLASCSSDLDEVLTASSKADVFYEAEEPALPDTVKLDVLDPDGMNMPAAPDYDDPSQWHIEEAQTGMAQVDVFYTCPTVIVTDYVQGWKTYGHMNTYDDNQRKEMDKEFVDASQAFSVTTNFYTFYYRQMSLQSFISESTVAKRFPYAFQDVKRAFNYYLEHFNQGRPFILAGFSQGGKATVELVKALTPTLKERMVAAYVIGYKVTPDDLGQSVNIVPATGRTDVGVTCCFSSVGDVRSIWPIIQEPVACGINPISWTTDGEAAEIPWVVGVDAALPVTVRQDLDRNIMFVSNYGTNDLGFYPATWVVGKQNYHTKEFTLYAPSIAQNVAERVAAYFSRTTGIRDIRW